ncbi:MAG: hypothetical protein U0694_15365 [Anaerolineae bacterium]
MWDEEVSDANEPEVERPLQQERWRYQPPRPPRRNAASERRLSRVSSLILTLYVSFVIALAVLAPWLNTLDPALLLAICVIAGVMITALPLGWYLRQAKDTGAEEPDETPEPPAVEEPVATAPRAYQPPKTHARAAVHAAGFDPDSPLPAVVVDIGVIAFWGKNSAHAHRTSSVLTSADAIQPYVELQPNAQGKSQIVFTLLNSRGEVVFERDIIRTLKRGERLLMTPPARLPLGQADFDGEWALQVTVNGLLMAVHYFTWRIDDVSSVEGSIDSDGEIDEAIVPLLADNYAQPLSLDDLLAGKNNVSDEQQA